MHFHVKSMMDNLYLKIETIGHELWLLDTQDNIMYFMLFKISDTRCTLLKPYDTLCIIFKQMCTKPAVYDVY